MLAALETVYKHDVIERMKRQRALIRALRLQNDRLVRELELLRARLRVLEPMRLPLMLSEHWDEEF